LLVSSPGTTPTVSTNNYAATSTKWGASFAAVSYGTGTTDLWGSSWTPSTINGSGFGVLIQVTISRLSGTVTASLYDSSVTVYYTAASPPGAPTGLAASNAGPNAVAFTWTQGSGTVTDSKIKYGTDGATFGSSIDIGSPATAYTVTGLTYGQLYFFEVSASNSSGDTYTSAVPYVCGSNWTGQVAASANDAFENSSGAVSIADATDTLSAASEYLGCRFPSVPIPPGQGIASATLSLYVTAGGVSSTVVFDCELSTASAAFAATTHDISARTLTGIAVSQIMPTSAGWTTSKNFAAAIEKVFNQSGGWSSGDPLSVIVAAASGLTSTTFEMFDGNPVQAAILAVFFCIAAEPVQRRDGPRDHWLGYQAILKIAALPHSG
jgi:hypothetical protein